MAAAAMIRRTLFAALIVVNALLLYQILGPDKALQEYLKTREIRKELRQDLERVGGDNARLSRRIRLLRNSTVYQEKVVRQKTGFVGPEEVLYLSFEP